MGSLGGRVAIVTGAGRGIGREHALLLAAEGARVVVNDLGVAPDGSGGDVGVAQAVASTDSVAEWQGARRIIDTAVRAFGDLHVVINNAGHGRTKTLINTP